MVIIKRREINKGHLFNKYRSRNNIKAFIYGNGIFGKG